MKIKNIVILLFCVSLVFLCGCWDYREYDDLTLVSAVGFDTDGTNKQVTVTLQSLVPSGGNSSQAGGSKSKTGSITEKATAASIDEALTKIQNIDQNRLFYGYMQEIVLGADAAEQITGDIMGFIDRTPNIRTSAYISVTPGTAEDVISTIETDVNHPSSKTIYSLIDQSTNSGSAFPVTILEFEQKLSESGEDAVAPTVTANKTEKNSNTSDSSLSNSSNVSSVSSSSNADDNIESDAVEVEQKNGYFKITGVAAYKNDKLAGWLNDKESLGLVWITNQKANPYEVVNTSSEQKVMNKMVFRVTSSKSKIKIQIDDNKPVVTIDTYVEADLRKFANNINADTLTPGVIELMQKSLADNVRTDIKNALNKGQKELKTDIFCIGNNFYKQYPKLWHSEYEKKWDEIFPTLQIKINVTAKVIDTGTSYKKFKIK